MIENIKYCHNPSTENISFLYDHVHIPWDRQIHMHRQDSWEISYIITGKGMRVIGDVMEPFSEGEIILIPPHIPHCWSFDEKVCDSEGKIENICIFFTDDFLKKNCTVFPELSGIVSKIQDCTNAISFGGKALLEIQNLMQAMSVENSIERLASIIKIFALAADAENINIVGRPVVEDKKLKKMQLIYLYVMNNYQNTIRLDEISKFIGMERSSFCVFFKKMSGQSFTSFLNDYRIEASCKMLLNNSMSVGEICNACGFGDIPYYNRTFKKTKGMTPSQFRTKHL